MRRSHNVPAESQSSSESWMPVLLTSRAEAIPWIGDKISISASEGRRCARRRSSPPTAVRTSEFFPIGGGGFECLGFLELMLPAVSPGYDDDAEYHLEPHHPDLNGDDSPNDRRLA